MNKSLSIAYMGEDWNNQLMQNIVEAGRTIGYVETLCNKADKLHLSIKQGDQRRFAHEFEKAVRFAIAKLKLKRVKIAFDVTEDRTWMKPTYSLRPSAHDDHAPSWQYLNVSIVDPYFFPLMSIPYRQIDNLDLLIIDLLKYIKTLRVTVELVLFDRGFYSAHLVDYLDGRKRGWSWPYLMLIPRIKKVKEYIEQTDSFNFFDHEFKYSKDQSNWRITTRIMVRRIDKETCWCYATNLKPSLKLVREYSKRWNIETGFRVHDEAKIKSKSRHPIIRLFYHLIGMLLVILWRLQNLKKGYVFKRYLKFVEYQFYPREIKELLVPP